jgi:sec-independent protein translocase protein TatC
MSDGEQKLTLLGHLSELRRRLTWSALAIAIGVAVCFIFYKQIFAILELPARGVPLIVIDPTERMSAIMLVCFIGGIIVAMPVLLYHGIMFVAPALSKQEKKGVFILIPWIAIMFLGGVVFGYYMLAPWTIWFLSGFGSELAAATYRLSAYIGFLSKLLLLVGLVFEMPVLTTLLARLGILKPQWLSGKRGLAMIISFVAAAIITPPDPITQLLLAIPLILLYELSILLAKVAYRRRQEAAERKAAAEL